MDEFEHTPRPVRLPKVSGELVGHRRYLCRLDDALSLSAAVVGLHGPSGAGKTTLLSAWAPAAAARYGREVLYADLDWTPGEGQTEAVLTAFLLGLHIPPSTVASLQPAQLPGYFQSVTREKRVLVVLDNATSAGQVLPLLPAAGNTTVVTSRDFLHDLPGKQIPVTPLNLENARELLRPAAGPDRVRADPEATGAVIEHCAGRPLALRIAGTNLAQTPALPVRQLAGELRSGTDLDAVIGATYRRLSPVAARTFRLLAAQPDRSAGPTTVHAPHLGEPYRGGAASAVTTREALGFPSFSAIHTLVSTNAGRSAPCWMPRPSRSQTRSSVARLPVAEPANGQPPRPPADESTVDTPQCSAARVFASAWP
ncbi:hypothetical protein FG385_22150 [Amycolatopsis alkalitolerans]|uniref:AAA+ ATPase domain-containing protein n=1 Tax=Amycolatopsis alkalitolerans TaxID=2547244 RepID=A0A5C4LYT1_9PSEU|nr:hypothetical protein FG385_22150 [Amycolatopsis alkalitolerans]